jgi:hypothetical protein
MKDRIAQVHALKCWPDFFEAILDDRKTFDIRKDDRDFQEGDYLILREYCPGSDIYSGRALVRRITYVLRNKPPWTPEGYAVLALWPGSFGQCMICDCTDEEGCPEGCWWVNEEHTLCSSCLNEAAEVNR